MRIFYSMREPLPIDEVLPEVAARIREGPALVLEAPAGAGKTTRIPPALLDLVPGEVVVLEPRRLAARTAARRVAQEMGERPGETVGYQVRFEDKTGPRTRLRYVTEGVLTRRLLADPLLRGVSAVVLDEFHERHLQGDVALALLLQLLRGSRPDLKIIVMSATLDSAPVAAHLGCSVVRSEGRRFEVALEHAERPDPRRLSDQVAAAVRKLTVPETSGDVLVFLPGAAEIRQAGEAVAELAAHRLLIVLPLHGDLPAEEQDRALAPASRRKIILSTNVAETSVTVPGVTAVVDSGLARIAAHSPWSGLPSLQVAKISRASAAQRAGRAGRTAPGRALRLYTRADHDGRPEHLSPEVRRLDLAELVLELRAAGHDPGRLPWLDAPATAALEAAEALLRRLGAVDAAGAATELGRRCARFPLHPRLSRMVLEAAARGAGREGAAAAAALGEGRGPRDRRSRDTIRNWSSAPPTASSDLIDLEGPERARAQIERLLGASRREPDRDAREEALRIAVLAGFPDRVAKRRAPGSSEVLLSSGGSATLSPGSAVRDAQLLVAVDVEERRGQGRLLRLASAIEPEWLLDLFPGELRESTELVWDEERGRAAVVSRMTYGALVLEEGRRAPGEAERAAAEAMLAAHLRPEALLAPEALRSFRARTELIAAQSPEAGVRALADADLAEALRELCRGRASLEEVRGADLGAALLERLGPGAARALATLAPEHVQLPGGRKLRIEYEPGQAPAARSRLQDFFGMRAGPRVAGGKVPVVLHLLAPNGRAQQVTSDLAGFWERHYPAVRRELMRRYPRHPWPEDGATATPPAPRTR
ncbi:MAG TPA: ATP-dependent helicase HrpB [Myxococcales bacterium]|nr:ATP-dependent helicase HrpB [Myxococcales bacterium]